MKFASALVLGTASLSEAFAKREPNQEMDGGIRMAAERVRSEQGGLVDVIHDQSFKLDNSNPSYLFMDTSALF